MQLHQLKSKTKRSSKKRVGRGGKRGTTSGHGTKGQRGRAGSYIRPGFAGGDNRKWQLFPKTRGASKKHGSKRPHRKHKYFQLRQAAAVPLNLNDLNVFQNGDTVNSQTLKEKGLLHDRAQKVKILGDGTLTKKLTFENVQLSKSAKEKAEKAGSKIVPAEGWSASGGK